MEHDVKVTVCNSKTIQRALEWFYRDSPEWQFLDQVEFTRRELDPENVLVASDDGQIRGVLMVQPGVGRVGWLWPPALGKTSGMSKANSVALRLLIRAGVSKLARAGSRFVQVLLPLQSEEASPLEANGFVRLTEMMRMERKLVAQGESPGEPSGLEFVPYGPHIAHDLQTVIERTYQGSMDCPELDALRPVDEVLESYRACGSFRPDLWLLVRRGEKFVGCLLLAYWPDTRICELQYMGVVPEARGNRMGLSLCDRAILDATRIGAHRICVSVDVRNGPAIKHYDGSGFVESDRRIVFVLDLRGATIGETG